MTARSRAVLLTVLMALAAGPAAAAPAKAPGFVLGGYGAPAHPQGLVRLDRAGLDYVIPFQLSSPPAARRFAARLDSLRVHRPGFHLREFAYLETGGPGTLFKNEDPVGHRAAILETLAPSAGLDNPSVAGWYLWDEPPTFYPGRRLPGTQVFAAIHEMVRIIRESTNKLPLVCLFPVQNLHALEPPCSRDTVAAYRCYLDAYLSPFDADPEPPPPILFDNYPFETPASASHLYFEQLATVRDAARRHGRSGSVPFWAVIQAAPRREDLRSPYRATPTLAQVRWQAYVSMAYGAKGIFYWTVQPWDPASPGPGFGPGFLERNGSIHAARYGALAALNAELRAVGSRLVALEPVGVHHEAGLGFRVPAEDESALGRWRSFAIRSPDGRAEPYGMLGYFTARQGGGEHVLVVNKDLDQARRFRVATGGRPSDVYAAAPGGGRIRIARRATLFTTRLLPPGGGSLYELRAPARR